MRGFFASLKNDKPLCLSGGGRGWARGPGGGFGDESGEEGAGGGALFEGAFGMPLDAEHKAATDAFGRAFDGLDDAVLGTAGGDAQAVAGNADGLMMAGVHGQAEKAVAHGDLLDGRDLAEQRVWRYGSGVGDGDGAAGLVVYGHRGEILQQGSAAPDVQHLGSEADGEDGFAHVVGILEEQFVDVLAREVGWRALFDGLLAILLGIDVGAAARQESSLAVGDELCGSRGRLPQRHRDGFPSAALDRDGVLIPRPVVVLEVGAGGNRNGDAGFGHRGERLNTDNTDDTDFLLAGSGSVQSVSSV